jgi:hypothetical protein
MNGSHMDVPFSFDITLLHMVLNCDMLRNNHRQVNMATKINKHFQIDNRRV